MNEESPIRGRMRRGNREPSAPAGEERDVVAALAIALAAAPSPRRRSALFREDSLAGAVRAFHERHGAPNAALAERARRWRADAAKAGRRLVFLGGPGYPPRLAEIATPPIVLDVAGALDLAAPSVAIVGSRRATPYGISQAERLGGGLAAAGLSVVSGLARGVDAAAHRAALAAPGATVAVLGSGHGRLYPPEHRGLADRIAAHGALVSEFPPDARPLRHHFPRRNRVIAGLTLGVVVVEAAARSGSLVTARHAVESDREVLAVPGPVGSPTSAGCHQLIRLGAVLVASVEHVLEELPRLMPAAVGDPGEGGPARSGPRVPAPEAPRDPDAARILETLARFPSGTDVDTLVAHTGLAIPVALAGVSALERQGRLRRFPGDFVRVAG